MYLAIATTDSVDLYHILYKKLRHLYSIFYKNTRQLKFSNGGHLLVLCDMKYIFIFDTFTRQRVYQVQISPCKENSFQFSQDDLLLAYITQEGSYQSINLSEMNKVGELIKQSDFKYKDVLVFDPRPGNEKVKEENSVDNQTVICVG